MPRLAMHLNAPTVRPHNVIRYREPQANALPHRPGGESGDGHR